VCEALFSYPRNTSEGKLKRDITTQMQVKFYTTVAFSELRASAILLPLTDPLAITAKEIKFCTTV